MSAECGNLIVNGCVNYGDKKVAAFGAREGCTRFKKSILQYL